MRAVLCRRWGGPGDLSLAEVPPPPLLPGTLRIGVRAAGVNFADALMIAGKYQENPALPFAPGFEVAGIVEEVAPDVAGWRVGEAAMGMLTHGGYADQAVLPAGQALKVPAGLDLAAAAGFPVTFGTAYGALAWRARLRPAERLVVFGAGGGLGLAAVAVGRALGAEVIAVAGGEARLALATAQGAAHAIDHRGADVATRIGEITGGRGADVVFDPVGGAAFEAGLRALGWGGRLVVVGFASGEVGQLSAGVALGRNIDLIGCYWGSYRAHVPAQVAHAYDELARWVERGRIVPPAPTPYPLAEAPAALDALLARRVAGKLVLVP
jgi:NADPH2:quinone reductase